MRDLLSRITKFLKRGKLAAIGAVIVMGAVGATVLAQPQAASAATCSAQDAHPETNIIYSGLAGSTAADMAASLKGYLATGSDGCGNSDLKAVYGTVTTTMLTDGSWYVGKTMANGTLVDSNNQVIGTSAQVGSRCKADMSNCFFKPPVDPDCKYTSLTSNVYMRPVHCYINDTGSPVVTLYHVNKSTGEVDFAIWKPCGNLIKVVPVPPKKSLVCVSLTKDLVNETDTAVSYTFNAVAAAQNTPITSYVFDFGDSSAPVTVASANQTTASAPHTYAKTDLTQTVTATVKVNGTVTSPNCQVQVVVKPKLVKSFECKQLVGTVSSSTNTSRTYTFTASTAGTESAATYQFFFTDANGNTVSSGVQSGNTATHMYTIDSSQNQTFSAYFVAVSTPSNLNTDKNDKNCQFSFSTQLVRTGPGDTFAIFGVASTIGAAIHQLVIRRKLLV